MSIQQTIAAVDAWQTNPSVHPLTCGHSSLHRPLRPMVFEDDRVGLYCLDCTYEQRHIPQVVLDTFRRRAP